MRWLFFESAAASQWTLVGSSGFTLAGGSGTTAVSLPGSPQAGDIAVVAWATDLVLSGSGVVAGQGYTLHYSNVDALIVDYQCASKKLGAAETTVNVRSEPGSTRIMAGVIQVWRGADQTTHIDVTSPTVATGTTGMPNAPSVTPANVGALVIAFGALDDDDVTATAPSGYGNVRSQSTGAGGTSGATVMLASKEVTTTAAENPAAFGGSGDDEWAAGCVVLRKAT